MVQAFLKGFPDHLNMMVFVYMAMSKRVPVHSYLESSYGQMDSGDEVGGL